MGGKVSATANFGGSVTATGSTITVGGALALNGHESGGSIDLDASGPIVVQAGVVLDTDGLNQGNGSIRLEGATVTIEGGPALSASKTGKGFFGDAGSVRLRSTAGDCTLAGRFSATGGNGIIEADATGNLTATGAFRAASDGCIALSANGVLDTASASFDVPVVGDCPGSPSGAFVDAPRS